jgi:adenylate cyclase
VSYYQALDPDRYLPKDIFKGKIVIIGRTTTVSVEPQKGTTDTFATPFLFLSSAKNRLMSGVEVHANIVHDFLTGEFVNRLSPAFATVLIVLIGILGSLIQINWKPFRSAIIMFVLLILVVALAFTLFARCRYWVPVFSMALPLPISYLIFGADAYLGAERKKLELKKVFSRYLSPSVLETVLANPESLKLGGIKVEATILFSDIAGFTSISEQNPPEVIAQLLHRYMTAMTRIITHHNGTIDKFIGDAIMAFWGAPLPDPDHALNACRSAVGMRKGLVQLNDELRKRGLREVSFRIGINTGDVIAGNMGSEDLFDYTVIGDPVNLASRLEGANKEFGTDILISGFVYDKVKDMAEVIPLGMINVKGKTEAVNVYSLQNVKGQ